jgi:ABC-2 type transport system permease protein
MFAELKHTLRRQRGQIIGWSIGLALFGVMMVAFYQNVTTMTDLDEFLSNYPEEMIAFFDSIYELNTPAGYLDTYYFSMMTIIIGVYAIGACANLLAGDEEKGILDLVMAHPLSRTALFWGRFLGFASALAVIMLIAWLSWAIPAGPSGLEATWIELLRPFLPLYATLLLFGAMALLFSMLLPAARLAGMLTGAILVGNYLMVGLANINEELELIMRFTPLHYYQGGKAVNGLEWGWLGGLLTAAVVLAAGAWLLFRRRDIRVGGERSWRLPQLAALLKKKGHTS